jgi:ureidoglycolate hydrolase
MELPVRTLTREAFEPFGRVIQRPARDHDATGPGWSWWAETHLLHGDGRRWGIGYLDLEPARLRFDWAERHMRTLEAIVPLGGDCLVYVAPPDHPDEPGRLPPFDRFQVFRVTAGSGVVMDPGVWHGAPLADGGPTQAMVLILEGTGQEDVTMVRFEETPVEIQRTEQED